MTTVKSNYTKAKSALESVNKALSTEIDSSKFERIRDYRSAVSQWSKANNIDINELELTFNNAQKALLAFGKSEAIKCGLSQCDADELFSIANYHMFDNLCEAALLR